MKQTQLFYILIFFFMSSCIHISPNSSVQDDVPTDYRSPANVSDLIEGTEKLKRDIKSEKVFNEKTCVSYIGAVTEYLYYLPADHFIPKSNSELSLLKRQGPQIVDTIFSIRLELKKRLAKMSLGKRLEPACVNKVREAFQYARFAEEYLLEWLHGVGVYQHRDVPVFAGGKPNLWSAEKSVELKGGDVLLIRGKSYISAMIARIADEEGNFSHVAVVGEDPQGKKYVIESLIHTGVIITPLEKWRQEQLARAALYRFYEPAIAQKAAKYAYELGVQSQNKNIRYDFAMEERDYSTMFCSEVVKYAYDRASGGGLQVPLYMSSLDKFKNRAFPANMGVLKNKIFAPFDIEVDPQFELIAEYRHRPYLRKVRVDDAILQSMYSWITDKNYQYQSTPNHAVKALLGKTIRQFGLMKETLPSYMPVKTINVVLQFESVYAILFDNLGRKETDYYRQHGHMMSFHDMIQVNEDLRRADCSQNLSQPQRAGQISSEFHWFFAPKQRKACADWAQN